MFLHVTSLTKYPAVAGTDIIWQDQFGNQIGTGGEITVFPTDNITYTAGTSSEKSDVLNKKIKITKTNRGGKHTIHSPGQKVVYFVLNLNERKKNIRFLVNQIESCIINVLKEFPA